MAALRVLGTALVLTGAAGAQFMIFDDPAHDPLVLSGLLLASLGFMTLSWAEHIADLENRRIRRERWRRQMARHWLPGV
ncbi:hypothetical protein E5163_11150 [Marinicauda algicola]|uniref:Uncharacterized protein n=1 Tax=Marinicauda algicola TaxID=2029849 RepID=A0A4S2GYQ8_9PROT|nr:hypothetical protein [Marinicauda algicola]TGY88370.1 hypothetical protein E5163_11150 [Marinicauda algicola]